MRPKIYLIHMDLHYSLEYLHKDFGIRNMKMVWTTEEMNINRIDVHGEVINCISWNVKKKNFNNY